MPTNRHYPTTRPSDLEAPSATGGSPTRDDVAAGGVNLLLGAMGARLGESLVAVRRAIQGLISSGALPLQQARPLTDAVESVHRIGKLGETLARLAAGRVRQSHEQVSLDTVLQRALEERSEFFQTRGVEVRKRVKPAAVVIDPTLLAFLLDALIDYAARPGGRLLISLEIKNWPSHAVLAFKTSQRIVAGGLNGDQVNPPDALSWHAVEEICRSIGLTVDRVASPEEIAVLVEFPRTVRQMEGLTAMEVDVGGDSWANGQSRALAGHRVLVITSDAALREDIKLVCKGMGLVVDSVPTSPMAVRFCEMEAPQLIIVDERFHDEVFDELRGDLLRQEPNFPFIEIGANPNTLSMASWMGDNMTAVNRSDLKGQLPQALAMEMAKIL